jgi:hypothetical protein
VTMNPALWICPHWTGVVEGDWEDARERANYLQ